MRRANSKGFDWDDGLTETPVPTPGNPRWSQMTTSDWKLESEEPEAFFGGNLPHSIRNTNSEIQR